MSIFGVKKEQGRDLQSLTVHVRELHKRVLSISDMERKIPDNQPDLEQRITALQQEIHNTRGALLTEINNQTDRYNGLQDRFKDLNIKHYLLQNSIIDKRVISITAETKSGIEKGELFSFGNGGRSGGYVCMFPGKILGMSLYSDRKKGDVTVAIIVNGKETQGYDITITRPSGHDNFSRPLAVEAGDVVNFICKSDNAGALNTIASLIIELLID